MVEAMVLIQADARAIPLRDGCVQTVVTSPPYFGLRDYGTGTWSGGDPACDHRKISPGTAAIARSTLDAGQSTNGHQQEGFRSVCGKCGALRVDAQIGLEPTPDAYVAQLVAVFREVRRVLKDDGTVWLNLGDSYAGSWGAQSREGQLVQPGEQGVGRLEAPGMVERGPTARNAGSIPALSTISRNQVLSAPKQRKTGSLERTPGLKSKDLIGIPWRVAFALQADGWYLRQYMPWLKRNGMPESVKDRPTTTIESVFLLSKSERCYYDREAVMKAGAIPAGTRAAKGSNQRSSLKDVNGRPPEYWEYTSTRMRRSSDWFFESFEGLLSDEQGGPLAFVVNTRAYAQAHFATMPEALVEPCIRAGSRPGDIVLDPFIGSGTVGAAAERLGRRWVGTDLNPAYHQLAKKRTAQRGLRLGM